MINLLAIYKMTFQRRLLLNPPNEPRAGKRPEGKNQGFTLVELLIVLGILGLLVGLGLPAYTKFLLGAQVTRCVGEIRSIQTDINGYLIDHEDLPDTLADINREDLLDPFGNPYQYLKIANDPAAARKGLFDNDLNIDYDLYSMGKDGLTTQKIKDAAGLDDIVRASEGGFLGTGKAF